MITYRGAEIPVGVCGELVERFPQSFSIRRGGVKGRRPSADRRSCLAEQTVFLVNPNGAENLLEVAWRLSLDPGLWLTPGRWRALSEPGFRPKARFELTKISRLSCCRAKRGIKPRLSIWPPSPKANSLAFLRAVETPIAVVRNSGNPRRFSPNPSEHERWSRAGRTHYVRKAEAELVERKKTMFLLTEDGRAIPCDILSRTSSEPVMLPIHAR